MGQLFKMRPIGRVTTRELSRATCSVLHRIRDHERIIVTRHGHPVAVMLSVPACIELIVSEERAMPARREARARAKRELVAMLLGPEIADDVSARQLRRVSRMLNPLPPGERGFYGR
jgi:antitoxin (DNA-binding transcriptional repressor) of toxin-antitoxin stability system